MKKQLLLFFHHSFALHLKPGLPRFRAFVSLALKLLPQSCLFIFAKVCSKTRFLTIGLLSGLELLFVFPHETSACGRSMKSHSQRLPLYGGVSWDFPSPSSAGLLAGLPLLYVFRFFCFAFSFSFSCLLLFLFWAFFQACLTTRPFHSS